MKNSEVPGILIAMPTLDGTFFEKSVILLCNYDEEGAFGLVMNHPSKTKVKEVLSDEMQNNSAFDVPLLVGGPVQPESFWAVHSSDFSVNNNVIQECLKANNHTDILNALKKLNGETFKHLKQITAMLQKILKRNLSSEELEFLGQKLHSKSQQTILHLTVYDGGIAQALRFETEAYLRMFNRLLPELKLNNLQCHVGDLGQTQFDQQQVGLLAKDWHIVTPPEVHLCCSPAFLHRV